MHLIVVAQTELPSDNGAIDEFVKEVSSKTYKDTGIDERTGWSRIRPRELRFFDFTIPEKALEPVLEDLAPYCGGKLEKLKKLLELPVIGSQITKFTGLEPVDTDSIRKKLKEENKISRKQIGARITILGKIKDK